MSNKKTKLGAVATFIRGVTFSRNQQETVINDSNLPILRAGNIQNELNTRTDLIFVPSSVVSEEKFLQMGDILICLSSGSPQIVGKSAQLDYPWRGSIGGFCGIIRPNDEVDHSYLALWMRGPKFISWRDGQARGANIQNLRFSDLVNLEINIPSVVEQRRIAARVKAQLAEVETARKAAEVQLTDAKLLQFRMLDSIFSELDSVPMKSIGDEATTTSGSTPARGNPVFWEPAEISWVKTGEIAFVPITQTEEFVSKKALVECSLRLLPPKTVLIAMYGQGKTRGQSAILEIEATTNQACFAVLPNETWEPEFLYFWLKKSYQDLRSLSENRGGNQANLNGSLLKAFEVPAPSKRVQMVVIKKINAVMQEVEKMERGIATQLEEIKGLPQKILSVAFGGGT